MGLGKFIKCFTATGKLPMVEDLPTDPKEETNPQEETTRTEDVCSKKFAEDKKQKKKLKAVGSKSGPDVPPAPRPRVPRTKMTRMEDSHSADNVSSSTVRQDYPDNYPPYRYRFQSDEFCESLSNYDGSDAANERAWSGLTGFYMDNDRRMG